MHPFNITRRSVVVLVSIIFFVALPLDAQTLEPPFFGPPGMHPNTISGLVDTDGIPGPSAGDSPAYFEWAAGRQQQAIATVNPWEDCATTPDAFVLETYMYPDRQGTYTEFVNSAFERGFYFDTFDDAGSPIGGSYWAEYGSTNFGTATLEKSDPGQDAYDQIHLQSGSPGRQIDVILPLVTHHGTGADYIGVGNIANLGVIGPCGNADVNTDIMIPLGSHNGSPAIIIDLEGDGSPSAGFLPSPPIVVSQPPPPEAIPTLSRWGFVILTISLLTIGLAILRWSGGGVSI